MAGDVQASQNEPLVAICQLPHTAPDSGRRASLSGRKACTLRSAPSAITIAKRHPRRATPGFCLTWAPLDSRQSSRLGEVQKRLDALEQALARKREEQRAKAAEAERQRIEQQAWDRVKDTDDPAALRDFMVRFPSIAPAR